MNERIIVYMVLRNISTKELLIRQVLQQAAKLSKDFFIVDHGSDDNTIEILEDLQKEFNLNLCIKNETFLGTMDDMKGKYYLFLKEKYSKSGKYILILDRDEVLDDELVDEINSLDFNADVYFINRNTYLIEKVIDRNAYLPLLFKINAVNIAPYETFHNLYKVRSKNTKKMKGVLHHYSYQSMYDLLQKNIYYAKGEAADLFFSHRNINNIVLLLKYIYESNTYFLYSLFYHFNFLHIEGWFYSLNWYVYKFYKYLFYLELKYGKEKKTPGDM